MSPDLIKLNYIWARVFNYILADKSEMQFFGFVTCILAKLCDQTFTKILQLAISCSNFMAYSWTQQLLSFWRESFWQNFAVKFLPKFWSLPNPSHDCLLGSTSLQLRGLVLETAAGKMLLPARNVSGLGEDVQVRVEAARDDRHVPAAFKGHLFQNSVRLTSYYNRRLTVKGEQRLIL